MEILRPGFNLTIISYSTPLYICQAAIKATEKDFGYSIKLINLRIIYLWDKAIVLKSIKRTS